MAHDWTFLLADLRTGTIYGEVPLSGGNPVKKLNASGTCSGSIPVRNIPGDPYRYTTPARTALYVLLDGQPWWGGVVWSRSYSAASGQVSIQCSDWWSYFDRRYIVLNRPPGSTDDGKTANQLLTYTAKPQNDIVAALIEAARAYTGGDLGIELRQNAAGCQGEMFGGIARTVAYPAYSLIPYGKALADLAALEDGPDLMFDTAEWSDAGTPRRLLRVGNPELTHTSDALVFEYGAGLLDYTWSSDGTQFASRTWGTGQAQESSTMMARSDNTARLAQGWPLIETSTQYQDIASYPNLVTRVASDAVANRSPLVTPSIVVRTDRPPYLNYAPGDFARLIIRDDYFRSGMDAEVRIIDVQPDLDSQTATLTVNPIYEDIS